MPTSQDSYKPVHLNASLALTMPVGIPINPLVDLSLLSGNHSLDLPPTSDIDVHLTHCRKGLSCSSRGPQASPRGPSSRPGSANQMARAP